MPADPRLTVAIPTCGRPEKLRLTVDSFRAMVVPLRIDVWDSAPCAENREHLTRQAGTRLFESETVTSPAESRFRLGERCETEFLLYADDDIVPRVDTASVLLDLMDHHPDADLVSARIVHNGRDIALTQMLELDHQNDDPVVRKRFGFAADVVGRDLVETHVPTPVMILRTAILDRVAFDPTYDFFFDLWDFGMQVRSERIAAYATPLAVVDHFPGGYGDAVTKRLTPRSVDAQRFIDKWGYVPTGNSGATRQIT